MQIFKFGGASVKDAEGIRNLEKIVQDFKKDQTVVVLSAVGKTTNKLEKVVKQAVAGEPYESELNEIIEYHLEIAGELLGDVPGEFKKWEKSLRGWCEKVKGKDALWSYDQIVPHGELMSTSIVHSFLSKNHQCVWVDARELIRTDQYFTEANIDWVVTTNRVVNKLTQYSDSIIVTQGFIGSDTEGNSTTLGREGSDFTGSILAHCLDAKSFTVWKDVEGILSADPRIMNDPEKYDRLSYQEVTEMTYYGAQIIHPKTLKPLAQKNIPLIVKSFDKPMSEGTMITSDTAKASVACFVFKENQLLVTAEAKDHNFMNEKKLGLILQVLDLLNVKINLMQNSALTFSFCIDNNETKAKRINELLNKDFTLSLEGDLHLATIKNYQEGSFDKLPAKMIILMEQKTAANYQVLYK